MLEECNVSCYLNYQTLMAVSVLFSWSLIFQDPREGSGHRYSAVAL